MTPAEAMGPGKMASYEPVGGSAGAGRSPLPTAAPTSASTVTKLAELITLLRG